MLALSCCGQQADALEAFHAAWRMLVEWNGVEPGPELQRLQEAILRQDVSLEAQPAAAELPPELDAGTAPPLVGRQSELAWVRQRWERARTGRGSLVTLTGVRGIGKSRLAAELAGDADRVGAGVVYCSGRGPRGDLKLLMLAVEHEVLENHIRHAIASDAQYRGHTAGVSQTSVCPLA
jgi:hypothetical protein